MIGIPKIQERIASSAEGPNSQTERVLPVETLTVTPVSSYSVARTYTGEIASLRASELGFERSGQLVDVLVNEGDIVNADAPLARLDIRNLQTQRQQLLAEKARANAQLMELEAGARSEDIAAAAAAVKDLEQQLGLQQVQRTRRESLYTQGAISREELDEFSFGEGALQARLEQSRSQLDELENGTRPEQVMAQQALVQQLDATIADLDVTIAKSTLRAPFEGVIATKQVDEGTVVGAGQSVVRLLENATPEVRIGMPLNAIDQLKIGDEKTVYLGERPYSATVSSILPEVDAQTRTQTVVLALESATASQASSGQTVRVNLQEIIPTEGIWLPTAALTEGIRGLWTCYVLVPDENLADAQYRVQPQSVEVLYQDSDRVLVRGTLQPNDMVVASGPHRLVPGQLVSPIN
ncbi:MAG: efflux RND transporter periplasmic adaptor subunit [Leptolyngbya sp. SIO3F4]|nr:efflux RND transporter periplasmic adaptor subunit [Leptolyngbya sp. SIO3F4]